MEGGREGGGRKKKWNEERKTEGERKEDGLREDRTVLAEHYPTS